jgi:hypothetical protein
MLPSPSRGAPRFPVATRCTSAVVDGAAADIVVTVFSDMIVVLVTHTGKLGTLVWQ